MQAWRWRHFGIDQLEAKMKEAAKKLDFEEAANCAIGEAACQKMAGSH